MKTMLLAGTAALLSAACSGGLPQAGLAPADVPQPPPLTGEHAAPDTIAAAIAAPDRPEADRERDALRRPADVLAFMDILPGETLLEMEAGSGYFTEIFANYLGADGKVYMQNPASFDSFIGDELPGRLEGLENVEYLKTNFDSLPLEDGSMDVVTWFQGPHELWFTPKDGGKLVDEIDAVFPEIIRVLKPGGSLFVIDHSAPEGSPPTTGGETHRIDPVVVTEMAEAAGFVLIARSDLFANPEDDRSVHVFDDSIRGRTDQFLIEFEKPEA